MSQTTPDLVAPVQITLDADTRELLAAHVDSGRFPSFEAAIAALVSDNALNEAEFDTADLSWAKSYVDEGLADLAAGRVRPASAVHAALRHRFGSSEG